MQLNRINDDFYVIDEGFVRCFLFIGNTYALLIDAGVEKGLKELIRTVTNLPIKLLLTHSDMDHTTAMSEFDDVYASREELSFRNLEAVKEIDFKEIKAGSYNFEIINIPGHTPGSIALLEKHKRFLISGDSVSKATIYMFGKGRSIDDWQKSLIKLNDYKEYIDWIYASHGELKIGPCQIENCLDLIEKVKEKKITSSSAPSNLPESVRVYATEKASIYY